MAFLESECERLHAELAAAYDFQKEEYNRTEDVIVGLEDQLATLRGQEPLPDIKTIGKAKLKVKSVSRLEPLWEQEPVAWLVEHDDYPAEVELVNEFDHTPEAIEKEEAMGWRLTPLYTAPQPAIPVEWVQAIVESVAEFVEIQQGGLNSPAVIGAAIRGKNTYSSYFYEAFLAALQEKNND
jgi:hypothetical protein